MSELIQIGGFKKIEFPEMGSMSLPETVMINPMLYYYWYNDDIVLYSPAQFATIINRDFLEILKATFDSKDLNVISQMFESPQKQEILDFLKYIMNMNNLRVVRPLTFNTLRNVGLVLFPTYRCNLRCKYCYADGGDLPYTMTWDLAKDAIDYFWNFSKGNMTLTFHGGGEATLAFDIIQKAVEYYEEKMASIGKKPTGYGIGTNGVVPEYKMKWMIEHNFSFTISLDGPPEINDKQRPTVGGYGSTAAVEKTIRLLNEHKANYGIRATITTLNVEIMDDIVDYCLSLGVKKLQLQPVFMLGRAHKYKDLDFMKLRFVKGFLRAFDKGKKVGMVVGYSGIDDYSKVKEKMCGTPGAMFCVTPHGWVTKCYEAIDSTDPENDPFFVGKWLKEQRTFELWPNKINTILCRSCENLTDCSTCFVRYTCSADCAKHAYETHKTLFKSGPFCALNKTANKTLIWKLATGEIDTIKGAPCVERRVELGNVSNGNSLSPYLKITHIPKLWMRRMQQQANPQIVCY